MTAHDLAWSPGALGPLLGDDGRDLSWQDAALCAQSDPEAWFPEKGGSVTLAKAICRRCPVRAECLEYALENDEGFGIWGGLSEPQRRRVAAAAPARAPAPVPLCGSRLHVMNPANRTPDGHCRECKRARDRERSQAARARGERGLAA